METSEYCEVLSALAKAYLYRNQDSCVQYSERELALGQALKDTTAIARAMTHLGKTTMRAQDFEQSEAYLEQVKAFGDAVKEIRPRVVSRIFRADLARVRGNIEVATQNLDEALTLLQGKDNPVLEGSVLLTYGNIWAEGLNKEKAREKYTRAAELFTQAGRTLGAAKSYENLGTLESDIPENAIPYYRKALEIYQKEGDAFLSLSVLGNLGSALEQNKQPDEALKVLEEAMEVQKIVGLAGADYVIKGAMGSAWEQKGDFAKAETLMLEAYDLAVQFEPVSQQTYSASRLYEFYKNRGDDANALKFMESYAIHKDSLTRTKNLEALAALDVKREYELKALQDSLEFVQQTAVFESQNIVERRTRHGLIIGVFLLVVFGIILANRNRIAQRQKRIIEENSRKLEEAEASRSRFFANISHELRTPLSVITGMSELIQNNPEKWSKKGSVLIEENGKNLMDLVNQILDLQKLEKQEMRAVMVQSDVLPFLTNSIRLFEPLAVKKGIDFSFEAQFGTLVMDFDREKLLRIVTNLVSNAVKFTESGEVKVVAKEQERGGRSFLNLQVHDTGIGIPQSEIDKIFKRFYQVETSSSKVGQGTGIGLNYVHELVQLLEGELEVDSESGRGSVFTVLLPITREAMELQNMERAENLADIAVGDAALQKGEGPQLLIIEDNPDIVELLMANLSDRFRIQVAENGIDGVEKARNEMPDLILSDVMMPGKDGFEVLDDLKNDTLTSHIPVVMLTAKADVESRLSGLRRGADDYIAKPFNSEELRIRLQNALLSRERFAERYAEGPPVEISEDVELQLEDAFLIRVREVLDAHLEDNTFGVQDFCRELGTSRTQLHNKMKALTGQPISTFIRNLRLDRARDMLSDSSLTVSEVAYKTGFASPSHFTRVFTERFQAAPSKNR